MQFQIGDIAILRALTDEEMTEYKTTHPMYGMVAWRVGMKFRIEGTRRGKGIPLRYLAQPIDEPAFIPFIVPAPMLQEITDV